MMPLGCGATSRDEVIGSNSQTQSGDLLICCHHHSAGGKKKLQNGEKVFDLDLVSLLMFNPSRKKGFWGNPISIQSDCYTFC